MNANEFDALCLDYVAKQLATDEAKIASDQAKAVIIAAVQEHGHVPTNAEASRRIEGADWCATVTTPSTVEIHDANVTELELLLSRAKLPGVFGSLFSRRVEYTLLKGAERVLPQTVLPKKYSERIVALYAQCFVPKKKTPSLKVEAIEVVRVREEKAAKKKAGR